MDSISKVTAQTNFFQQAAMFRCPLFSTLSHNRGIPLGVWSSWFLVLPHVFCWVRAIIFSIDLQLKLYSKCDQAYRTICYNDLLNDHRRHVHILHHLHHLPLWVFPGQAHYHLVLQADNFLIFRLFTSS